MSKRKKPLPTDRQESLITDAASEAAAATFRLSFGKLLASICVLAFFLRITNVLQTFEVPTLVRLLGDARGYFDWAERIAGGDWYGTETFYQAPLYPYFLAVLLKLVGPSVTFIRLVQVLLGVTGVAMIGLAARKQFSERIGLVAAFLLATYPPAIFYDGIIQKAALATFLVCALMAACAYLQSEPRWWYAAYAGTLLGLLVLTRENALIWTPIIPLWILTGGTGSLRQKGIMVGAYTCGLLLILLPVAARNASLGGEWSPSTFQAGPNFYIGNSLQANGVYVPLVPGHETPVYERADAKRIAEQAVGHPLSARKVSQFWMNQAWNEIRQSPSRWFQLMLAKTFMVFNRYEVPDVESMYIYREYSVPLQISRVWHFGLLCPLAIGGLVATGSEWRKLWLYYLLLLTMVAAVAAFFVLGRYRNPIALLFIPFAAAGLNDLYQRAKERQWRDSIVTAAVFVLTAIGCNLPVHDEPSLEASCYMNMGISASQAGDLPTGIRLLQRAIVEYPEMAEGYVNLGRAYMLDRQPERAVHCYQAALLLDPRLQGVHFQLGQAWEQCGETQQAIEQYEQARIANPSDTRAIEALSRLR